MQTAHEVVDVLVVGSGFAGLSAAKQYLHCAPATNLVIVDYGKSLGGVWARERIYPGLKSNNLLGTFELPSHPLHVGLGVKGGEYIPGEILHEYLCDYASAFDLESRIRLNTRVVSAEKLNADKIDTNREAGWLVLLGRTDPISGSISSRCVQAKKLIVATGLTSQAEPTAIAGDQDFGAPIIAQPQIGAGAYEILELAPEKAQSITVLGGSKSAHDAVYLFASKGFRVHWIIRPQGYGPTWMAKSHVKIGPKTFWLEPLTNVRLLTWLSPCIWGENSGLGYWARLLLHRTRLGRWLVDTFWAKLSSDTLEQSGILRHPSLKPLIPPESAFWYATSLAILNYPTDIHDFVVSGQVKVHRQEVTHLSRHRVHLSDGTVLPSEAGLVAKANWNWKPNITFLPSSLHSDLGIPSRSYEKHQEAFWAELESRADAEILHALPRLKTAPKPNVTPAPAASDDTTKSSSGSSRSQPFRLFHFIAPPGLTAKDDRSLAFAGFATNLLGHARNEIAGLWIYAYMNRQLASDQHSPTSSSAKASPPDYAYLASLHQRYCALRFPYGFGHRFPDFVFEQIPFFDVLLTDLGLRTKRKSSWWREIFEPYGTGDYRRIAEEWCEMRSMRDARGKKDV